MCMRWTHARDGTRRRMRQQGCSGWARPRGGRTLLEVPRPSKNKRRASSPMHDRQAPSQANKHPVEGTCECTMSECRAKSSKQAHNRHTTYACCARRLIYAKMRGAQWLILCGCEFHFRMIDIKVTLLGTSNHFTFITSPI